MAVHLRHNKITAAVIAASGLALAAVAIASPGWADTGGGPQHAPRAAAAVAVARLPVVVDCAGHNQVRPGQYILACGDGNAYLARLTWAAWGHSDAFGTGTEAIRVCIPSCVSGRLHSFPVLTALWHALPLPGHPGTAYFTRLTVIYTGNRSYTAGGKKYRLPQTQTYPLSQFGGAGG